MMRLHHSMTTTRVAASFSLFFWTAVTLAAGELSAQEATGLGTEAQPSSTTIADEKTGDGKPSDETASEEETSGEKTGDEETSDEKTGDGKPSDEKTGDEETSDEKTGDEKNSDGKNSDGKNSDGKNSDGKSSDPIAQVADMVLQTVTGSDPHLVDQALSRVAWGKVAWAKIISIQGMLVLWGRAAEPVPAQGDSQFQIPGNFQLRFARLVLRANPHRKVEGKIVLAFDNVIPLFDYELTYKATPYFQLAAGQWRMHMGGQIATPASALVMLDRPNYTLQMAKARFRDMGVRVQSGAHGIFDGVLNYRLSVMNGSGITTTGPFGITGDLTQFLVIGRLVLDAAPLLFAPEVSGEKTVYTKKRIRLGAFVTATRDGAIPDLADGSRNLAGSAQLLGQDLVPYWEDRATVLGGLDFELAMYNAWLMAELLVLHSQGTETITTSVGAALDLAYRIEPIYTQFAGRVEVFDPLADLNLTDAATRDEIVDLTLGVNFEPLSFIQISAYLGARTALGDLSNGGRPRLRFDSRAKLMF